MAVGCVALIAILDFALGVLPPDDSPAGLRESARELYAMGEFQRAEKILTERLANTPEDRASLELLLRARVSAGGTEAALNLRDGYLSGTELAGLIAQSPDAEQHRLFLTLAWPLGERLRNYGEDPGERVRRQILTELLGPHPNMDTRLYKQLARFMMDRDAPVGAVSLADYGLGRTAGRAEPFDHRSRDRDALRTTLLDALLIANRYTEFLKYMELPEFRAAADDYQRYQDHLKRGEYNAMIAPMLAFENQKYRPGDVLAALAVGVCWLVLLLMLARANTWSRWAWLAGALALPLGVLSAKLTLVALMITEEFIPFSQLEPTTINVLIKMVLGVGAREELLKLLCFLPLIPLLLYARAHSTVVIAVGALIGLGFAVEENVSYYADAGGGAVIARYLTANFFHMTLSGFAGYYLMRAVQSKPGKTGEGWTDFAAVLLLIIGLHGLYDFLLSGVFEGSGQIAIVLHVALTYQFLTLFAEQTNQGPPRWLPLGYVFTASLMLLAGTGYLMLHQTLSAPDAIRTVIRESLGLATIAAVFFIGFRESLSGHT